MIAMLFATIAFSIDAMLPALPQIASELTPDAVNHAQLILTAFVLGMGIGTAFAGPISDATGRKPAIIGGFAIYIGGAVLAHYAPTIELLLAARVIQGLGAAGPRIVGLALVRDLYEGREMARVTSFAMTIFMIVPAVAPSIGALIIGLAGWRAVFLAFILFGLIAVSWVGTRQPETLPPDHRRRLSGHNILLAAREVLSNRDVRIYTVVMTLGFGQMFALLSTAQQLFDVTYGQGDNFPKWFALMAGIAATASVLNAKLVMHVGMRRLATDAYLWQAISSAVVLALVLGGVGTGNLGFAVFFIWGSSVFFMAGLTFGNLNALALQRMGHIAGMAASVISAISTIFAVVIAGPVGQTFDGTAVPVITGVVICSGLAWLLMRRTLPH
ncbi:multidrug effflux MFS transporter [Defluviimonas sp. WL0002]|uniref:Multidrug effflux MFS transporter n=2 Tax=Albidovulum marisflavi TaxID=2984159 RepID=A0ABT2ZFS0_9RHOB|nr:multidrug effflux MFS transporter [Defluviimonas sp. WL0002]MCV2869969.1 multidrug effflux MFS transporter [Defluviimonas sp. WL0002]